MADGRPQRPAQAGLHVRGVRLQATGGVTVSRQSFAISPDLPHSDHVVTKASRVDLVGILFILWGILTTLIGVSTLALGVGAIALITSASRRGGDGQFAAGLTAAAFTTLAIIALVWGIGHIAVGLHLRRLEARARLAALMLGSVDLVLLPYGTALGIYALWVLLHEEGKKLFE